MLKLNNVLKVASNLKSKQLIAKSLSSHNAPVDPSVGYNFSMISIYINIES